MYSVLDLSADSVHTRLGEDVWKAFPAAAVLLQPSQVVLGCMSCAVVSALRVRPVAVIIC